MSGNKRIPTDGGQGLSHNPFAALSSEGLPPAPENPPVDPPPPAKPAKKNRGRVDIIRQTAGRGGKTVTVVKGFAGIGLPEKFTYPTGQGAKDQEFSTETARILGSISPPKTPLRESKQN
jgi:hypothetical protein